MLIIKSGKRQIAERLPNQERFRTFKRKETYKNLEILEAENITQAEMKEKNKREFQTNKKTFQNLG